MRNKYAKIRSRCISLIWLIVFGVSLTRLLGITIPDMVLRAIGLTVMVLIPVLVYSTQKMYRK